MKLTSRSIKFAALPSSLLAALTFALSGCHDTFDPYFELRDTQDQEIDTFIHDSMIHSRIVGLGLAVVIDGKAAYLRGYGYEDWDSQTEVDPSLTLFRWASVSKTVTGTLAALYASESKLTLDREVRKSYPAFNKPDITLRMLLNHTSGIQHYGNGDVDPEPSASDRNDPEINTGIAWALPIWMDAPLVTMSPGFQYSYSSPAFNLAGAVIERELGGPTGPGHRSFTQLVRDEISEPFGMTDFQADFYWQNLPHRATGYVLPSKDSPEVYEDDFSDVSWKAPSGGFVSTAADAAHYCEGLLDDAVYPKAAKKILWTPGQTTTGDTLGYGLGWSVANDANGDTIKAAHNGYQQKAESAFWIYPKRRMCLAVFSNTRDDVNKEGVISPSKLLEGVRAIIEQRQASNLPAILPMPEHWTSEHKRRLVHAQDLHAALKVAVHPRPIGFMPSRAEETEITLSELSEISGPNPAPSQGSGSGLSKD